MVILGPVCRSYPGCRNGIAQQGGIDVVCAECGALVESQDDQGSIRVESGIREQRSEPVTSPCAGCCDGSIVAVVGWKTSVQAKESRKWAVLAGGDGAVLTHIGGDEHPLGELVIVQVPVEHGEVLALSQAVDVGCDRIIAHQGTAVPVVSSP